MTIRAHAASAAAPSAKSASALASIVLAMLIGAGVVFVTGHVQASALHDAAHDARHATGFPCH